LRPETPSGEAIAAVGVLLAGTAAFDVNERRDRDV
jgi:hypothetical protein